MFCYEKIHINIIYFCNYPYYIIPHMKKGNVLNLLHDVYEDYEVHNLHSILFLCDCKGKSTP